MNIPDEVASKVMQELQQLDATPLTIDGRALMPCSCYYFGYNPLHVLYNTNCPDALKEQIENIISKHVADESGTNGVFS